MSGLQENVQELQSDAGYTGAGYHACFILIKFVILHFQWTPLNFS